jgi:hypothetical protein
MSKSFGNFLVGVDGLIIVSDCVYVLIDACVDDCVGVLICLICFLFFSLGKFLGRTTGADPLCGGWLSDPLKTQTVKMCIHQSHCTHRTDVLMTLC